MAHPRFRVSSENGNSFESNALDISDYIGKLGWSISGNFVEHSLTEVVLWVRNS